MKKLLFGLTALPFLASIALAGQPLSDQQMDRVVAGFTACCDANQPAPPLPGTPTTMTVQPFLSAFTISAFSVISVSAFPVISVSSFPSL
jgi:hypothetical protein